MEWTRAFILCIVAFFNSGIETNVRNMLRLICQCPDCLKTVETGQENKYRLKQVVVSQMHGQECGQKLW